MTTGSFAKGLVGVVLDDRYRLDAVLGEGGMGSVFRAQHLAMDRKVAVKLLKPHLTQDRIAAQRFLREARATMKVESPHAVRVLDFGVTPHGDYYMALEYLDGRTVQRELEVDGPFAPARVLHIARQALHALGAAHRIGLVHRDIKPDNILLMKVGDDADYAKLLDFGVAKLMEGTAVSSQSALQLTQAGMVFGTPEFMSPEQACGHPLDGRSDLYSLAATMFAMLTGCALFEGKSAIELLTHHVRTPPPALALLQPELAQFPRLDELLQRCLAKRREDRPATAEELDDQLAQLVDYVKRGGAAAPRGALRSPSALSSSAYFQALPPDLVDPGATLMPDEGALLGAKVRASSPTVEPPVGSGALTAASPGVTGSTQAASAVARRRGAVLALVGLGVLAVIAVAIALVVRKRAGEAPRDAAVIATVSADAAALPASADAAPRDATETRDEPVVPRDAGAPVAERPRDAGPRTQREGTHAARPDARPAARSEARPGSDATPGPHLEAAEAALREGNRLRQLAEADLALADDPRNVRAKYLLADALIKGGDAERGCAMLRALGRYPLAIARANAANCP